MTVSFNPCRTRKCMVDPSFHCFAVYIRKPLVNGCLLEIEAKNLALLSRAKSYQKKSEPFLHLNDLKYISNVPQMDLKCTPSNFKVNKDLRCRMVTWIYLDFIIYFELFLQGNMDLWCRLITNICKLLGDCFRTIRQTFYNCYLPPPPSIMSEGGRFGGVRGGYGVTGLLRAFIFHPPPL